MIVSHTGSWLVLFLLVASEFSNEANGFWSTRKEITNKIIRYAAEKGNQLCEDPGELHGFSIVKASFADDFDPCESSFHLPEDQRRYECRYLKATRIEDGTEKIVSPREVPIISEHKKGLGFRDILRVAYTMKLASHCQLHLRDHLELYLNQLNDTDISQKLIKEVSRFNHMTRTFRWHTKDEIKSHANFVFTWKSTLSQLKSTGEIPMNTTGYGQLIDLGALKVKTEDIATLRRAKDICLDDQVRKVYQETVLPVMMLIDLGFSGGHKRMDSPLVKEWYEVAQICELLFKHSFRGDSSDN